MTRFQSHVHTAGDHPLPSPVANFYREEILKHLALLRLQRECFSERALASAEQALDRLLAHLDALCERQNAGELFSRLLAALDCLTGVSSQCDRKHIH